MTAAGEIGLEKCRIYAFLTQNQNVVLSVLVLQYPRQFFHTAANSDNQGIRASSAVSKSPKIPASHDDHLCSHPVSA